MQKYKRSIVVMISSVCVILALVVTTKNCKRVRKRLWFAADETLSYECHRL